MNWANYISYFFGGVFLANAIPHIVSGIMGRAFQSPFAKPPGQKGFRHRPSNSVRGFFNLAWLISLFSTLETFGLHSTADALALGTGLSFNGLLNARHFGRFHGGNSPENLMPGPVETHRESDRLDPLIWKIGSVVAPGSFLSQLDATVDVSLSSLAATFHSSLSAIQWVTSGDLLALALILPLSGWMVDRIGAKALYLWCFSAFTLSSALCGFSWSANFSIGFRILQGMSGGLTAPMAQMMMARTAGKHMASVLGFAAMPILSAPLRSGDRRCHPAIR